MPQEILQRLPIAFTWVKAGGKPTTKFSKRGDDRISIFKGGLLGKRGWTFLGGAVFTKKN